MQLKMPNSVRASLVVLGLCAANPALAEDLPSSSTPASREWKVMHPATFAGTHQSAVDQCLRDAALNLGDLLTPEKCALAAQKLKSGDYKVVMVPDGIVHDFMNGRNSVLRNSVKSTGRLDRALLLDLGDGVFMYWYTGDRGRSCNNVAFSIVKLVTPPPPAPPPPPKEAECRVVTGPPVIHKEDTVTYNIEGTMVCINGVWYPINNTSVTVRGDTFTTQSISTVCDEKE